MPQNYHGAIWPAYFGAGVGQHRESGALDRSNFTCMLTSLGGASETVVVVRECHWAVGWIEWMAIHQDDEKALQIADDIVDRLQDQDDPVIDDEHRREVEYLDACADWLDNYRVEDRVAYIRQHRSQFEFSSFGDMLGCVRGRLSRKAQRRRPAVDLGSSAPSPPRPRSADVRS